MYRTIFRNNKITNEKTTHRIWQIGFLDCSAIVASVWIFRAQVDEALTPVEGDCQYVLFNVTVPPQVVTTSVK